MKLLFTGSGRSGSWQVRGVQLGKACNATVKPMATVEDCRQADLIILVKRPRPEVLRAVKASGKPWLWDILDSYPQPTCTGWDRDTAIQWVRSKVREYKPTAVIWPNQEMCLDCGGGFVLPHHHRPGIAINPIRETIGTIGYEGSARYLGGWLDRLVKICKSRGWDFYTNPQNLSELDVVVAFRDKPFNGYIQSHWKSNVKLANAHGSGTPFIGPAERGYVETSTGFEQWANNPEALISSLEALESHEYRETVSEAFRSAAYSVDDCASDLIAYAMQQ